MGVWIEISLYVLLLIVIVSLPSWECGLKSERACATEIPWSVAPFVGVWIEICKSSFVSVEIVSLPSWECGLKLYILQSAFSFLTRRSLRGSVD